MVKLEWNDKKHPPKTCVSSIGSLKRWLHFQLETGKTRSKAKEDIRMAKRAMIAAEEVITQMEDSLVLEEASLDFRARELRRQSLETFKIMGDVKNLKSALHSYLLQWIYVLAVLILQAVRTVN